MGKATFTTSMTMSGDIGATYDLILRKISEIGFSESSSTWPSEIVFKRGKKTMLARKLEDIKTELKISLKQASGNVNIFLELTFGVGKSFFEQNDVDELFEKIKREILTATTHGSTQGKICDICLNPIAAGEEFCKNCGRSANRQKVETVQETKSNLNVSFDPNKVQFGQKIVDDALYGGIPKNSVVLITSPACEEKDIIVSRFVETGLDQSEVVINISTDNKISQNVNSEKNKLFYQVICNAQADSANSKCLTENCVNVRGVERLTELSVALTSLLNNISKNIEESKPKRVVIDIISDTLLSNQSVNTRKWLRETITKFKQKNCTILATLNPHMHTKEEAQSLLDLFDGQIDLYEKEINGEPRICMRIKRLSNSQYSTKECNLIREDMLLKKEN